MKNIKHYAFWPAFILLGGALILQFANPDAFFNVFSTASSFFMEKMAWFAIIVTILCSIVCIWAAFSKFGNVRIGGKDAKPKLKTFSWFSIALTSSLASGLLVWGPAEPIYHIQDPASAITGIEAMSGDAFLFASETMYMHWSFLPYGIMTTSAITFAFMYYNARRPYSVISELAPVLHGHEKGKVADIIDGVILFCVTVAIAASLGQMLLNITYGIGFTTGISAGTGVMLIITVVIVILAVGTAISGLQKGIKFLADFNTYGYFVLLAAILLGGGTFYILNIGTEGMGSFLNHIFDRSMMTGAAHDTLWPSWWTTFYWASYFAWTPTLGMFMGSISYGRKIKDLIFVNVIGCGGFGAIWCMIISGSSLERQANGIVDLVSILNEEGIGAVPYKMLESLPLGFPIAVLYLVILIISFITCANANVSVMAGLASKDVPLDDPTGAPAFQKVIWGVICSGIAFVVVAAIGIDGVKQLANVSGLLAIFIQVAIIASIVVLIKKWRAFDETGTYLKEDPADELK